VVLPYNKKLRDHFQWASLHMCGETTHLLKIFTEQLKINEFQGFGWKVNLDKVAEIMGGRVVPMSLLYRHGHAGAGERSYALGD
jgi:hypothetical protein